MEKLIEILKQFDQERTKRKENWNEVSVAESFHPIAENILCNGYFLVNGKYIIDLGAIELYYHEEEGDIKDYIMYHTNEHSSKSKVFELNGGFPYFKFGSFNLHQSGVDVTFENEIKKYRASFLIRSYRVFCKEEKHKLNDLTIPFDKCSTHIFDDMFYGGISLLDNEATIKWIASDNKNGDIEQCPRRNVAMYLDSQKVSKDDYESNKGDLMTKVSNPHFFKYNGQDYLQENRLWQYKRIGIIEN